MLRAIQEFLDVQVALITRDSADAEQAERGYQLATAVLLLEMTRADFEVRREERQAVLDGMRSAFGLTEEETQRLVLLAEEEVDHVTSLHEYTNLIKQHLSAEQRRHVIELLWRVAFADGELDKYEDYLVRKVADLLYVRHSEFMKAKHRVQAELGL